MTSAGNKFDDFPRNQMAKFHAKFFEFYAHFAKLVNSAKRRIAIASKTVIGQYGSSTVLQQVNVQSDHHCTFLRVP